MVRKTLTTYREWQNLIQIGDDFTVGTQYYQPFDAGLRWFFDATAFYRLEDRPLYIDEERVAEYRTTRVGGDGHLGWVLGNWGDLRVGAFNGRREASVSVGFSFLPEVDLSEGGLRFQFRVDTEDSPAFPTRGIELDLRYEDSREGLGSETGTDVGSLNAKYSHMLGKNVLRAALEATSTLGTASIPGSTYSLGGFTRLSGLATDQLIGDRGGLFSLGYYRQLSRIDMSSIRVRLYVGATAEAGLIGFEGDALGTDDLIYAGSIFGGADTPIGPVYLGLGLAEGGHLRAYLLIGGRI